MTEFRVSSWRITRLDDGIIEIREDLADSTTSTPLEFVEAAGAVIEVAIADARLPMTIRLHTPDLAAWWLPYVIGDTATAHVVGLEETGPDAGTRAFPDTGGYLTDVVRRYALGAWLRRWWIPGHPREKDPASVKEWLLDAEYGVLAADAAPIFLTDEIALQVLEPRAFAIAEGLRARLAELRGSDRADASARQDAVASTLAKATGVLIDLLPGDHPALEQLEHAESAYWNDQPVERQVAWPSARSEYALAAELKGEPHPALIDPLEVHPRAVPAEAALWWNDGKRIRVEIAARAGSLPVEPGELFARFEVGEETYAIPLERTAGGFQGERKIAAVLEAWPVDVRASIYSDRFSAGGRRARGSADVEETWHLIRAISAARATIADSLEAALEPSPAAPFAAELDYAR